MSFISLIYFTNGSTIVKCAQILMTNWRWEEKLYLYVGNPPEFRNLCGNGNHVSEGFLSADDWSLHAEAGVKCSFWTAIIDGFNINVLIFYRWKQLTILLMLNRISNSLTVDNTEQLEWNFALWLWFSCTECDHFYLCLFYYSQPSLWSETWSRNIIQFYKLVLRKHCCCTKNELIFGCTSV